MNARVVNSSGAVQGLYFVIYPGSAASPDVRIAISHNGLLVNSQQPSLPPAEADGSVRVVSSIPFAGVDPGVYEITVTAAQGGVTARRTAVVEVE